MDLLSAEYDRTLNLLQKEIDAYKEEQKELKMQTTHLVESNRRIFSELKDTWLIRLEDQPADTKIEDLEYQLHAAIECKNSFMEMWQAAVKETEHLQRLLEEKDSSPASGNGEALEFERRIFQVKSSYAKGLSVLTEELAEVKKKLLESKEELKNKGKMLEENHNSLQEYKKKVEVQEKTLNNVVIEKKNVMAEIVELQFQLANSTKVIDEYSKEISIFRKKNSELLSVNSELKQQNSELELLKSSSQKDAKESLLTAEEAILQKKEVIYKEQQALKRIQELKASISQEVEHATMRYRNEIKNVTKQCDERVKTLMNEIQNLQVENSEKQSLFERAVREKQALESKLESVCSEHTKGHFVSDAMFDEMSHRLTMTEQSRGEFKLRVQLLESKLKELEQNKNLEIQHIQTESKNAKEQLKRVQKDLSETLIERNTLSEQLIKTKKHCLEVEKELKSVRDRLQNEKSVIEQIFLEKQQAYEQKLQKTDEYYKKVIAELQLLLDAQYDINKKWKDAFQELTVKSEMKINEMHENIVVLQNENEELDKVLQKTRMQSF